MCCHCLDWGCWRTCWVPRGVPGLRVWGRCHGKRGSAGDKGCAECCHPVTACVECAMMHGAEVGGDAAAKAGVHDGGGGGDDGAAQETVRHPPRSWR